MGGATVANQFDTKCNNISIHAPRGGSDRSSAGDSRRSCNFNPRSPWGERHGLRRPPESDFRFQSTLPVGGATLASPVGILTGSISIHAPRGGSDNANAILGLSSLNFNPRSPWGERLIETATNALAAGFQSTLPVGGATPSLSHEWIIEDISIHAPRGGSDL